MAFELVAIKHFCPRGQVSNPSLPPCGQTWFFRKPPPSALSTRFMNDPVLKVRIHKYRKCLTASQKKLKFARLWLISKWNRKIGQFSRCRILMSLGCPMPITYEWEMKSSFLYIRVLCDIVILALPYNRNNKWNREDMNIRIWKIFTMFWRVSIEI